MAKPSLELIYEDPRSNKRILIWEVDTVCIRGLVIDRQSEHTVSLCAVSLITCSAYIFSFTNYAGVEKAIIYQATSPGPKYAGWIASQIATETDLSTVSIIIATPADEVSCADSGTDLTDINDIHSSYLYRVGFTGKVQVLFGNSSYTINSKGKHGCEKLLNELVFLKPTRIEACTNTLEDERSLDEKKTSCLLL
ncbi:hypothetical protein [Legionella moravica]|nr:hypothetical protein [Legionella moravica]